MSGLLSWLSRPIDAQPDSGLNNLGLIGATLRDVGAQLNGDEAKALHSFQERARRQSLQKKMPSVRERSLKPFDIQPPADLNERVRALVQTLPPLG